MEAFAKNYGLFTLEQKSDSPRLLVYQPQYDKLAHEAIVDDTAMGKILEFACPGELASTDNNTVTFTFNLQTSQLLKGNPITLIAEVCGDKRNIKYIEDKYKRYQTGILELFPETKFWTTIKVNYSPQFIAQTLLQYSRDFTKQEDLNEIRSSLTNLLEDNGFVESAKLVERNHLDIDQEYARTWLLFVEYIINDPSEPLFPLSTEVDIQLRERLANFEESVYSLLGPL